jgi:hypothetical protein
MANRKFNFFGENRAKNKLTDEAIGCKTAQKERNDQKYR